MSKQMDEWRWQRFAASLQERTARRLGRTLRHRLGVTSCTLHCEDCGLSFQAIEMARGVA